jgi:hypothetical protein
MLKSLPQRWEAYNQTLTDTEEMLKKNKVNLIFFISKSLLF